VLCEDIRTTLRDSAIFASGDVDDQASAAGAIFRTLGYRVRLGRRVVGQSVTLMFSVASPDAEDWTPFGFGFVDDDLRGDSPMPTATPMTPDEMKKWSDPTRVRTLATQIADGAKNHEGDDRVLFETLATILRACVERIEFEKEVTAAYRSVTHASVQEILEAGALAHRIDPERLWAMSCDEYLTAIGQPRKPA
jgi:hypothetical protein